MQVVIPLPIDLARTGASPVYVYAEWASGQSYPAGTIRRKVCSGVSWDYRANFGHTSSASNSPSCTRNTYHWTKVGLSGTTGGWTYTTNTRLSGALTWTSGASVAVGDARFDDATNHDYRATVALTTAQNTIRPSEALISSDELTRQRWSDIGAANAWAPFDYKIASRLEGYAPDGSLLSSVKFTFTAGAADTANRIMLVGLRNVVTVTAKIYHDAVLAQTVSATLYTLTPMGQLPDTAMLSLTAAGTSVTEVTVEITLARGAYSARPIEVGVVAFGFGYELGQTHAEGLELTEIPFSTIARDPVFGDTEFIKRGSARVIRCQLSYDPRTLPRYAVLNLLRFVQGSPVAWDFNNTGGTDPTLRVFGFQARQSLQPVASSHEVLTLDIEGLVE